MNNLQKLHNDTIKRVFELEQQGEYDKAKQALLEFLIIYRQLGGVWLSKWGIR